MFGAIEISGLENKNLIEKAGREGFIENKAYRQLQAILKNFFVQLAADFFDDKGRTPQSEFWLKKKDEINTYRLALDRRDKLAKSRKDKFLKDLDVFFKKLTSNVFKEDVNKILNDTRDNFNTITYLKDLDQASQKIIDYEFGARQRLVEYRKSIRVSSPKGFTPTKSSRIDFETYLVEFEI